MGSLLQSLARSIAGPPRLNFHTARKAFRSRGWIMERDASNQMSMLVRVEKLGLLGFRILNDAPRENDLYHVRFWENSRSSVGMILTETDWSLEIRDLAFARGVMILKWPDIDNVIGRYEQFKEKRARELEAAKKSTRAALPPLEASLSKPLSEGQVSESVVFSTGAVACWFIDRGGSELVISFAHRGSNPHMKSRIGEAVAAAARCSALGFETSEQNWFPAEDMAQCIEAAELVLQARFPTRMLFGSSQGGFAAIRFSGALQATSVLALSPQYSIDPGVIDDPRFKAKYDPTIHSGMHIAPSHVRGVVTLIYDPFDPTDRAQAERIAAEIPVQKLPRPFSGHGCACILAVPKETITLMCLCGLGDLRGAGKIAARQRRLDPKRAYAMAFYCSEHRPEYGYRLFRRYSAALPSLAWGHVCFRLAHRGFASGVIGWVREHADKNPANAEAQALVALVALQAADLQLAHTYIFRAREIEPLNERFLYITSLLLAAGKA
jgi:hypothetical protein